MQSRVRFVSVRSTKKRKAILRIDITAPNDPLQVKNRGKMKKSKNKRLTIEFTKDKLDKTIKTVKAELALRKGIEGLCLYVGKFKHTYYAHWGMVLNLMERERQQGRKKLGSYELPIAEIKSRLKLTMMNGRVKASELTELQQKLQQILLELLFLMEYQAANKK